MIEHIKNYLMMISKKEFLGKTRSSETGLYDWSRGQGRVKMIRAVEAGIEIDGKAAVGGFPWKWLRISSDQDHLAQSFLAPTLPSVVMFAVGRTSCTENRRQQLPLLEKEET